MKTVIKFLICVMTTVGMAQTVTTVELEEEKEVKINEISVSISVDSAEEVMSTFDIKDIKELIAEVESNKDLNFEITCNNQNTTSGTPSSLTYRIKGNSDDQKKFIKGIKELRQAAIKYYKNKS